MSNKEAIERRRARRRPVLDTFSLFAVVPKKGVHRLLVHDLSDFGIGFELDAEGEDLGSFPITAGEHLDLRLYLNQSLFLPLAVEIVRIEDRPGVRKIGAEFRDQSSKGYQAFRSFLRMLDDIVDAVKIFPS